jgi:hypothetical protein
MDPPPNHQLIKDRGGTRSGLERRQPGNTTAVFNRRSGRDRRSGTDRRKNPACPRRPRKGEGVERRDMFRNSSLFLF